MRTIILAVMLSLPTASANAGQCQDDIAAIDKALSTKEVAPDVKAQAQDMRKQAEQLCSAGNEQEGLDMTAEAKSLLAIE